MSEENEGQEQTIDKGDFDARLESEPGFAVQEYKKMQSEQQKTFNKLKEFEAISDMIDQAPGSTAQDVVDATRAYIGVMGNPEMAKLIQEFQQTGEMPKPPAPKTGEGDLDDIFGDLEEPKNEQLEELKKELNELKAQSTQTQIVQSKSDIHKHLDRYFSEDTMAKWLTDEEKDVVLKDIEAQMKDLERRPNGAEALKSLNYESIDLLATRKTKKWYSEIAERAHKAALQDKQRLDTGSAEGISTHGSEQHPTKAFNKDTAARDAVAEFRRMEARGES